MGWSSGTEPFCVIAEAVKANVKEAGARRNIYKAMYRAFRDQDWDCTEEALGIDPILDAIIEGGTE